MAIRFNDRYVQNFLAKDALANIAPEVKAAHDTLTRRDGAGADFLGWVDLPENYDKEEFARIKVAAAKIQKSCDVLVVIGIGGSYLGARAAIEFVRSANYNLLKKDTPEIYFAGNSISANYLAEILAACEGKDLCVNVISKSGTTTEPAIAFRIFRELLEKKYGKDAAKDRIFVTTDKARGKLKELSDDRGYETFVVPDDVGGRYSVLTAVGLLPIAVAGVDIDALMAGARKARADFAVCDLAKNDCYRYAAVRNLLSRAGKDIEIMVGYEPSLAMTNEWWKQLYGESEGKDGKGIFPASVIFSTDLHSMGQMIQEGKRNIFETVLNVKTSRATVLVPEDPENLDGLNFLSGKPFHEINQTAFAATVLAHCDGNVPNLILDIDAMDAENFGYLVYFFELACAISGYMLGVNPFNQPGVEGYKNNMFALLGKPGAQYDALREALKGRI